MGQVCNIKSLSQSHQLNTSLPLQIKAGQRIKLSACLCEHAFKSVTESDNGLFISPQNYKYAQQN